MFKKSLHVPGAQGVRVTYVVIKKYPQIFFKMTLDSFLGGSEVAEHEYDDQKVPLLDWKKKQDDMKAEQHTTVTPAVDHSYQRPVPRALLFYVHLELLFLILHGRYGI